MERPAKRRVTYTLYDNYTLSKKELEIYGAIVKETILKKKRCAQLSLSALSGKTGIAESSIDYQLKKLQKRRLIEIDNTQKTNTICIIVLYKEIQGWGYD